MREITKEQILERMRFENPWWGRYPTIPYLYRKMRHRPYFELFFPLVKKKDPHRAVVLMGLRRVGKTVMLHQAIQRLIDSGIDPKLIFYLSIENPIYNGFGLEELFSYLKEASNAKRKSGFIVFFDEIQYLKDWEIHLKTLFDSYHYDRFIVSGSSAVALRLKSIESGAGRFRDFLLPPLYFYEYLYLINKTSIVPNLRDNIDSTSLKQLNEEFINYLNYGGFPEVIFSEGIQKKPDEYIKSDIIDKVLMRDLPSLYGIQDIRELNSFFNTLAYNTAGEVSLEKLSASSNVAKNTIKRYLEYLEAAYLIKLVYRIDRVGKPFKRDNFFKVYLTIPSLYCAFFGPVNSESANIGQLVETAAFAQESFQTKQPLNYARWKNGEIDIIGLSKGKPSKVIEVKWSDRQIMNPSELKSLFKFCHEHNITEATVTTKTMRVRKTIENININFIPASLFCFYAWHFFRQLPDDSTKKSPL